MPKSWKDFSRWKKKRAADIKMITSFMIWYTLSIIKYTRLSIGAPVQTQPNPSPLAKDELHPIMGKKIPHPS